MHEIDFVVAIPARLGSTRLPNKALALIGDEPMVVHVARRASAAGARQVVVATDDLAIARAVEDAGFAACMTHAGHQSGTDRLAECATLLGWGPSQVVVNLQGDEPFAPAAGIRAVASALVEAPSARIATLASPVLDMETLFNPNSVKVVLDDRQMALYFSRAPIPWDRDRFAFDRTSPPAPGYLRHVGIYAYDVQTLQELSRLPVSTLERLEGLEQLRALQSGMSITVRVTPVEFPAGVDTAEDLDRARRSFAAHGSTRG